jgi:hypothetical protein
MIGKKTNNNKQQQPAKSMTISSTGSFLCTSDKNKCRLNVHYWLIAYSYRVHHSDHGSD